MNKLVIYPEYPELIKRNNDYKVVVNQGSESHEIPVYNYVRQSANVREDWMDDYRRFAEFAFEGEGVRVDITVNMSFSSYTLMPSAHNYKSEVNGNVISVYLDKPATFMIRLGDRTNTMLTVFTEKPEEEIPDRNDPNVIFVDKWLAPEEKVINLTSDQTLYIAPGAVLYSRISGRGENIKILGRGMILDPHDTRTYNIHGETEIVIFHDSKNVTIKGVKTYDGHFYHLYMENCDGAVIDGFKMMSNIISTDGMTIRDCKNFKFSNIYGDVCDDSMVCHGNIENVSFDEIIIGSTCGVFSFVGLKKNLTFNNIHIFRASEAVFKNLYTSNPDNLFGGTVIQNLDTVDCAWWNGLLVSNGQGRGHKEFVFKNLSLRTPHGNCNQSTPEKDRTHRFIGIGNGSEFFINLENLWIDGKLITSADQLVLNDKSEDGATINVTVNEDTANGLPVKPNTVYLDKPYTAPEKQYAPYTLGEELFDNGGFEDGAGEWGSCMFIHPYLVSDEVHSGKYAMHMPIIRPWMGITIGLVERYLRAGKGKYRLSFWTKLKHDSKPGMVTASIELTYGEATETESIKSFATRERFELKPEWSENVFEFELDIEPKDVNTAYFRLTGTEDTPYEYYLDDISLVKIG